VGVNFLVTCRQAQDTDQELYGVIAQSVSVGIATGYGLDERGVEFESR
jgi:hypothetical protein